MKTVNMHEAKTRLSQLVEAVEAGEEILIARAGKPVARLTKVGGPDGGIKLGLARGLIGEVPADFDAPLDPEILITPLPARRKK